MRGSLQLVTSRRTMCSVDVTSGGLAIYFTVEVLMA